MTLQEALDIIGTAFLASLLRVEGSEIMAFPLYHAIIEEWFDGNLDPKTDAGKFSDEYGPNILRQAARVIADNIKIYGDVK